jgi:hypothetical protein
MDERKDNTRTKHHVDATRFGTHPLKSLERKAAFFLAPIEDNPKYREAM